MNLGIFGGTFNPVHLGHLRVAEEVRERLDLDRLLFVPAKLPPHKTTDNLADAALRLELVGLAVEDNPHFGVSPVEIEREGPSYSIDTLSHFTNTEQPESLWFIMGSDQYRELHTWRSYREIMETANLAVMRRPPDAASLAPPPGMGGEFTATPDGYVHRKGKVIRFLEVTPLSISATAVRQALKEGKSIRYLVPEPVRERLLEGKRNP